MERPVKVFISYSHEDGPHREALERHLASLQREGLIETWTDRRILPGADWQGTIDEHLDESGIVLCLLSSHFLASDYCWDTEMQQAMTMHRDGKTRVIPIIVRPCVLIEPFKSLQCLPRNAVAVTSWDDRDEAWVNVTQGIRSAAQNLGGAPRLHEGSGIAQQLQKFRDRLAARAVERVRALAPKVLMPCPRISAGVFFHGDSSTPRYYLDREMESMGSRSDAGQTTLLEIVEDWKAHPSDTAYSSPVLFIGASGTGKTTEQLRIAFDRSHDAITYMVQYNSILFEHVAKADSEFPFESVLLKQLDLDYDIETVRLCLKKLEPTVFMLDLSDVPESEDQRINFVLQMGDFYDRYSHHLLIIAYRIPGSERKDEVLSSIFRRMPGTEMFRLFKFLPLKSEQVNHYWSNTRQDSADALGHWLAPEIASSPLMVHLLSKLPNPEALNFKGQVYEQFIRLFFDSEKIADSTVALRYVRAIARFMCEKCTLKITEEELDEALAKDQASSDPMVKALLELGVIQAVTPDPSERHYKLLHDSFVFYFAASAIHHADSSRWTDVLDGIVSRELNPQNFQALLYLPGILEEHGRRQDFVAWFCQRYRTNVRSMKSGSKEATSRDLSLRRSIEQMLELANSLALEDTTAYTRILLETLRERDDRLRFFAIKCAINSADHQLKSIDPGDTQPVSSLEVPRRLAKSIGEDLSRSRFAALSLGISAFLQTILIPSRAPLIYIQLDSLAHLLLITTGRVLSAKWWRRDLGRHLANEFANLFLDLVPPKKTLNRSLAERAIAGWVIKAYQANTEYPCNFLEIKRALFPRTLHEGAGELASPEVIQEIGELFVPDPARLASQADRIRELCGARNGMIAWYMSTVIPIHGNVPECLDGVLEILGDLPRSAPPDSISIPHYVALRSLHSLVAFSETARKVPAVRRLFESVSQDAIDAGPWVIFEDVGRKRSYRNYALRHLADYYSARGEMDHFKDLLEAQLLRAQSFKAFEAILKDLAWVGIKRGSVGYVLEVLDWLQGLDRVYLDEVRVKAVAETYEQMLPSNPLIVSRAWKDCRFEGVRRRYRNSEELDPSIHGTLNRFVDTSLQSFLLMERVQLAVREWTLKAVAAESVSEFFLVQVRDFLDFIEDFLATG